MKGLRLRLPATSANLGPGFDAVGLAMSLWLEVDAEEAAQFTIEAAGRDVELVASLKRNLILDTYRALAPRGPALALRISNGIPLGMGCGSSAAALVAGVMLANHFGELGWSDEKVLAKACELEGHPDNVAACVLGGFTVSAMADGQVTTATFGEGLPWRLVLALPRVSLATKKARSLLPDFYSQVDVVQNTQATALLVAAFALGRSELLRSASQDRVHQPYRSEACVLLPRLLPLAGHGGVLSVTLSGAGPSVLLLVDPGAQMDVLEGQVRAACGDDLAELLVAQIAGGASTT